ncbi:hypothetical protein P2W68_01690 [Chryseobacterium arthrosphaerae]|uniref:hypothetical protein n=1 Tax=Chryseobacterium arthrosphaerae TaxID=651561 RepID=UPI0023E21425|nr:hypothetical protein [Chryseobacterium arthrosphaerae]WES98337.1 hypothetical protein P2W68_01690 [Chryseobacterium arthrosphaerae]
MDYTIKLSKSQEKKLCTEAKSFEIYDIGEYLLEKIKAAIRLEESESIRNLMETQDLSAEQKMTLKEFGETYFESLSKSKIFFQNEEHFVIRLKLKLQE